MRASKTSHGFRMRAIAESGASRGAHGEQTWHAKNTIPLPEEVDGRSRGMEVAGSGEPGGVAEQALEGKVHVGFQLASAAAWPART